MKQQSLFGYPMFRSVADGLRKEQVIKGVIASLDANRAYVSPHDEAALRRVITRISAHKSASLEESDVQLIIAEIRRKWVS